VPVDTTEDGMSASDTSTIGTKDQGMGRYTGGCHCGRIRYAVRFDPSRGGSRCNCSICTKIGGVGGHVKPDAFEALYDESQASTYRWGTVSTRYFCPTCGVHCYARGDLPELGGAFVSFYVNTLDAVDPNELTHIHWDGRHDNWEAGARPSAWPVFRDAAERAAAARA